MLDRWISAYSEVVYFSTTWTWERWIWSDLGPDGKVTGSVEVRCESLEAWPNALRMEMEVTAIDGMAPDPNNPQHKAMLREYEVNTSYTPDGLRFEWSTQTDRFHETSSPLKAISNFNPERAPFPLAIWIRDHAAEFLISEEPAESGGLVYFDIQRPGRHMRLMLGENPAQEAPVLLGLDVLRPDGTPGYRVRFSDFRKIDGVHLVPHRREIERSQAVGTELVQRESAAILESLTVFSSLDGAAFDPDLSGRYTVASNGEVRDGAGNVVGRVEMSSNVSPNQRWLLLVGIIGTGFVAGGCVWMFLRRRAA